MGLKLERLLQLFAALALMAIISTSPATIAAAQFVFDTPDVSNLLIQDDTSPPIIDPQLAGATGPIQFAATGRVTATAYDIWQHKPDGTSAVVSTIKFQP